MGIITRVLKVWRNLRSVGREKRGIWEAFFLTIPFLNEFWSEKLKVVSARKDGKVVRN